MNKIKSLKNITDSSMLCFNIVITVIFILSSCAGKNFFIRDQVELNNGSILIAFSNSKDLKHVKFFDPVSADKLETNSFLAENKSINIKKCKYINEKTRILITEKNGFFFVLLNNETPETIHVSCNKEKFPTCQTGNVFFHESTREISVVYDTEKGNGVTMCSIDEKWNPDKCKTFTKKNSGLLSDDVEQVVKDQNNNIWFKYPMYLKKGVTKLSPDGSWDHFNQDNSKLGHSSVKAIKIEKKDRGLEGDNIWFITDNGLTGLQYKDGKEVWTMYGNKRDSKDAFVRVFGMEYISKKRVVNINGIAFGENSIFLSNKLGLFQFDGKNITRHIPDGLKGSYKKEAVTIIQRHNNIILPVATFRYKYAEFTDIKIFNLKTKKWGTISLWKYNKAYPSDVHITPVNDNIDFISLSYAQENPVFLLLDRERVEVKKIDARMLGVVLKK